MKFLKNTVFSQLKDEEIIKISDHLTPLQLESGQYLTQEGDEADSLFIIESGCVEVLKHHFADREVAIGKVSAGAIIGDVAFFGNSRRSADVIASGPVSVLELHFSDIKKMVSEDCPFGVRLYHAISNSLIEKLKRTNIDLTEMISNSYLSILGSVATEIAHEVNNPLTAIWLLNSEISNMIKRNDVDQARMLKNTTAIDQSLGHISKIINGIRMVGRDAKNDPMEKSALKEILESTVQLCQGKIKKMEIDVQISVPDGLIVQCRPTQISQVILNLLSNSCDAIEKLPERWIKIEAKETPEHLTIIVTDSGKGIPAEIQRKMFFSFYSTKEPGRGVGIGLSISKKLVESHQGSLFVDADSPHTRFVIQLPKAA